MSAEIISKTLHFLKENPDKSYGALILLADQQDPEILEYLASVDGMQFADRMLNELLMLRGMESQEKPLSFCINFYVAVCKSGFSSACSFFQISEDEAKSCEKRGKIEAIRIYVRAGQTQNPDTVQMAKLGHEYGLSGSVMQDLIVFGKQSFDALVQQVKRDCAGVPNLDPCAVLADKIGIAQSAIRF